MNVLKTLTIAAAGLLLAFTAAGASEIQKTAKDISYSFEGPSATSTRGSCSAAIRSTRKCARPAMRCT